MSRAPRLVPLLLASALLAGAAGCRAVPYTEQGLFDTPAMSFGSHPLHAEVRGHVLVPREASIGGFSEVGAGGCGCH